VLDAERARSVRLGVGSNSFMVSLLLLLLLPQSDIRSCEVSTGGLCARVGLWAPSSRALDASVERLWGTAH
jgi:hypothetical protein